MRTCSLLMASPSVGFLPRIAQRMKLPTSVWNSVAPLSSSAANARASVLDQNAEFAREQLAREFEPTAQSISHWVAQADRQEGRREEKGNGLSAGAKRCPQILDHFAIRRPTKAMRRDCADQRSEPGGAPRGANAPSASTGTKSTNSP